MGATLPGSLLKSQLLHVEIAGRLVKFIMYGHWRARSLKKGLCTVSFNFWDTSPFLLSSSLITYCYYVELPGSFLQAVLDLIISAVVVAYFA